MKQLTTKTKKILVGRQDEYALVLELGHDNRNNKPYFSICGEEYDIADVFNSEQGEQRAIEYLSDGEYWKSAVQSGSTDLSMDEWNQQVINIDGWEEVLGDVTYIGDDKHVVLSSCGQTGSDSKIEDFSKLLISKEDFATILKAWNKLHLKTIENFNKEEEELYKQVLQVFNKYEEFDDADLQQLIEVEA